MGTLRTTTDEKPRAEQTCLTITEARRKKISEDKLNLARQIPKQPINYLENHSN